MEDAKNLNDNSHYPWSKKLWFVRAYRMDDNESDPEEVNAIGIFTTKEKAIEAGKLYVENAVKKYGKDFVAAEFMPIYINTLGPIVDIRDDAGIDWGTAFDNQ